MLQMKKAIQLACVAVVVGALGSAVMADGIGFTLDGSSSAYATAYADLIEYPWNSQTSSSIDGTTPATVVALAMYGDFDEFGNWFDYYVMTEVQANITASNNTIQSSGSLSMDANSPGTSTGSIDNYFSGTITIGTSDAFPNGTEGLMLEISMNAGIDDLVEMEINSSYVSSSTEIAVFAGEVLNIEFRHTGYLTEEHSSSASAYFSVTPEPATMTLLAIGGLALLRQRRRK